MLHCVLLLVTQVAFVAVSGQNDDTQCLLQARPWVSSSGHSELSRTSISTKELIAAEALFTCRKGEADHENVGGDRMSKRRHNYAPIYAKYMSSLLKDGGVPTVVEVGILTGTGLAMWSRLFPESHIFGFDLNTSSYHNNIEHMRSLGFDDARVKVTEMNQMNDNKKLLGPIFVDLQPRIVVDDGYHIPEAGEKTFLSMKPFLAKRFVYFIEDLIMKDIQAGRWEPVKKNILKECPSCKFSIECPPVSDKKECVAVIHSLQEKITAFQSQPVALAEYFARASTPMTHTSKLQHPHYDTMAVSMPWELGEQPLARCPSVGQKVSPQSHEADANLQKAASIFCQAGLDSLVEFYVDPRFKGNYERLRGPDGWIEKAYLSYMGLHTPKDNISAEEDLLVQSAHHFSTYPIVLTNFGTRVSKHLTPERFPNLVLMHARSSATAIHKGFNLNKLISMMFTKVKGGVVLDADQWLNRGIDVMIERAFEETTKAYPYPILPVHFMSRDPESDDMKHFPSSWTFTFKSKEAPRRTMRWGHAHPTWTHYALPWLAKWTSYVLAPEKTGSPAWLQAQGFVSDEPLLNFASWADGLTRQWCKFDIPNLKDFAAYLHHNNFHGDQLGVDSKFFPKGIPFMFLSSHDAKDPQESYYWLSQVWESGDNNRKSILYDGSWFGSGAELKSYDPSLKCLAA